MYRAALSFVLGVFVLLTNSVAAQEATPSASPAAEASTGHISELAIVQLGEITGGYLHLVRVLIDPGAPEGQILTGPMVFWVESGEVVFRLLGPAQINHPDSTFEPVEANEVTLSAGDSIAIPVGTSFALPRNDTDEPAVVFSAVILGQ